MSDKLTLMAIFAHPDDEAFGTGGMLAKYAHEGVEVHLVTATLGESGQLANPALVLTEPLHILREQELRCACAQYGIVNLHLLGYMDGQTAVVRPSAAVYKLVKLIRQYRPQVIVTFGPEGIYGHFDHLVVHRWASAAYKVAADLERWPEAGEPHQVAKLYYRGMAQSQVDKMRETFGRDYVWMDGVPFPFMGYPDEQITTKVDVREHVEAKLRGISCHASQLDPNLPYLHEDFDPLADAGFWEETFILAEQRLPTPTILPETDLFAGLR